jgi:hypothetical protein
MTAGMHRRPNQRRDALHAAARDTWTLIRLTWLILATLISRRAYPRAAGGATATVMTAPVAPEAPAPTSGAPVREQRAGASPQPPDAAPEGVTAPATPGAARPPWVTWHGPPGTPPPPPRLAPRRDTIAMPAVDAALSARYLAAHEAQRDAPAVTL